MSASSAMIVLPFWTLRPPLMCKLRTITHEYAFETNPLTGFTERSVPATRNATVSMRGIGREPTSRESDRRFANFQ